MNSDLLSGFPEAAQWSLTAGIVGKSFVFAGLVLFLLAAVLSAMRRPKPAAISLGLGSAVLLGTMAVLMALFVKDQFQYQYVFAHGDASTELKYKIAGVWSGQQGSFLLWGCASALFGMCAMRGAGPYRRWYTIVFSLFLASICGILAYETPFTIMKEVLAHGKVFLPTRGAGLTPSLQNYWVVIHPPTIFVGFGALTAMFAYAVAAMATGDLEGWVPRVRPWALTALAILGLGICMGGFWAYETLGWGGFWKWDPVENVSFVPWLVTAGLIHGLIVQTTRKRWYASNLVLAGLPFLLFVYGTFLTRSGLLTNVSVHSFAQMDANALKILLGFLLLATVGFFGLFLGRGLKLAKTLSTGFDNEEKGVRREGLYRFGVLTLSLLSLVISIGMSWPVIMSVTGRKMAVVEEPLYHKVVTWFFVPIMLLMAIAPFVSWRRTARKRWSALANCFSASVLATGVTAFAYRNPTWGVHLDQKASIPMPFGVYVALLPWMVFLTWLCLFVVVSNLWRVVEIARRSPLSIGGFVSHFGLAVLMGGLILSRGFERSEEIDVAAGMPAQGLGYTVSYQGLTKTDIHDRNGEAKFLMDGPEGRIVATPGLYYFPDQNGDDKAMTWPHIEHSASHDVYVALGEPQIFLWKEPVWFKPGQEQTVRSVTVRFEKMTMHGQPGQMGTKFGAQCLVSYQGKAYRVTPTFAIGGGPQIVPIDRNLAIVMERMNAADGSVALQMLFTSPIFPLTVFYKPMVVLVWLGAGILFLGGLMAAFYRRPRTAMSPAAERSNLAPSSEGIEHATIPATQS